MIRVLENLKEVASLSNKKEGMKSCGKGENDAFPVEIVCVSRSNNYLMYKTIKKSCVFVCLFVFKQPCRSPLARLPRKVSSGQNLLGDERTVFTACQLESGTIKGEVCDAKILFKSLIKRAVGFSAFLY